MMQVVPNSFETLLLLKELVFSATTQLSTNMYYFKYILSNSFELWSVEQKKIMDHFDDFTGGEKN